MSAHDRIGFSTLLLAGLACLAVSGCEDSRLSAGPLAVFDFEQEGWTLKAERTNEVAHGGSWSGMLDVGFGSGNAFSPLVHCGRGGVLKITWHELLPEMGDEHLSLLIHGYADQPAEHPAIPALPNQVGTRSLRSFKEAHSDWREGHASVPLDRLHPDTAWVRLEWRVILPLAMRGKGRAAPVFFDDISIMRKGSRNGR